MAFLVEHEMETKWQKLTVDYLCLSQLDILKSSAMVDVRFHGRNVPKLAELRVEKERGRSEVEALILEDLAGQRLGMAGWTPSAKQNASEAYRAIRTCTTYEIKKVQLRGISTKLSIAANAAMIRVASDALESSGSLIEIAIVVNFRVILM